MKLVPIFGLVTAAWLLIIAETYIFFEAIIDYIPPLHIIGSLTLLALLKVGMTFGLVVMWVVVIAWLTRLYASSKMKHPPATPSS